MEKKTMLELLQE